MNVLLYTCGYMFIMLSVILERRLLWIHKLLFSLRRVSDHVFAHPFFQDEDSIQFQTHETLQIPFFMVTLLATALAIFVKLQGDAREIASLRIGQLILSNLFILCLISSRHSVFLELAAAHQADYLFAHKILGFVTLFETIVFAGLRLKGKVSHFIDMCSGLITRRVPHRMAWHFGE